VWVWDSGFDMFRSCAGSTLARGRVHGRAVGLCGVLPKRRCECLVLRWLLLQRRAAADPPSWRAEEEERRQRRLRGRGLVEAATLWVRS
jgi:hypothetical protein